MAHANARTNLYARKLIVSRWLAGWPAARIAEQLGVSRATVYKWIRRYEQGGEAALVDRSSRPQHMPARTAPRVEKRVLSARSRRKRGAVVLAAELGLVASTVGRILARHDVPHLAVIDPITGERLRASRRSENRYEHPTPGAMIHVDVKKLGKIPPGGGWRLHGREATVAHKHKKTKLGYDFVHTVHRRPHPPGLQRDPRRRERPHRRRVPAPRPGLVRRPGRHHPPRVDRQRHGLSPRRRLGMGLRRVAAQTPLHQARLSLDQRQSRTVQPHPAHRMGLRPTLDQQSTPPPRP